jgi:hypothetical protein
MDHGEQVPYPVVAVVDLATNFSREHFEFAVIQCRNAIALVVADNNRSEQQIARGRLLRYVDLQLSRAVRWIDQESDLMALILRSLIELRFWAEFISQGNDKAKHFLEEANTDSKDIYDRLVKAFPDETTPYDFPPTVKRISPVRASDAEELLWKVCSKFIHPTPFVLDSPEASVFSEGYRELFAVKIVFYGWGILEMLHTIIWTE